MGDPIEVLPAVFHALWHGHLAAPLDVPLNERALVSPGTDGTNGLTGTGFPGSGDGR
ncbi:hypothetical protein [Streptomyces sp. NBC_00365]|uniref:hypothetical protein n=1 Tax=Streptomyces sp. NBC_00365 TaxID=2975726 RepID=UPI002B1D9F53|nr:hypothetical protein [Streptomyces sp. NBC_00365]